MAKITIYLEDTLAQSVKDVAKARNISQSRWVVSLIEQALKDEWPTEVKSLAGAWQQFPALAEIRETTGEDTPRECI